MNHLRNITSNTPSIKRIRIVLLVVFGFLTILELIVYFLDLYPSANALMYPIRGLALLVLLYSYLFGRLFIFDPRELIVEFDSFSFIKSMMNINMHPINQFSRSQIIEYSFDRKLLYNYLVVKRRKSNKEDVIIRVPFSRFNNKIESNLKSQLSEIMDYNKKNPDPFVRAT